MDFTSSGLVIDSVTITARVTTTETGKVDWKLEGNDENMENLAISNCMYYCGNSLLMNQSSFMHVMKLEQFFS